MSAPLTTRSIMKFEAALKRGFAEGVVTHIFHQVPGTMPDLLEPTETTS